MTETEVFELVSEGDADIVITATALHSVGDELEKGKEWAWNDSQRRLSKRKKDELDLIRLGEAYPDIRALLPPAIRQQIQDAS